MEDIKPMDWARIFAGSAPPEFYLELVIRALFIYLLLMTGMRLLGKRMSTQVSRIELCAVVAFASAVGVPLLSPQNGLLPAVIIAAIIVGITRLIAVISYRSQQFEQVTQGDLDCLVSDSVLNMKTMKRTRITRERLFAQLRSECLNHLGRVKRVYIEANGSFTVIPDETPRPGLMVLPDFDTDFIEEKLRTTNIEICNNCGAEKPHKTSANSVTKCKNCGEAEWTRAVVET